MQIRLKKVEMERLKKLNIQINKAKIDENLECLNLTDLAHLVIEKGLEKLEKDQG